MNRMRKLRIMTSHLYFYKKLDEYGKDHDKRILEILKNEEQRHGMKVKENEGISGENVAVNETKTITNSSVSVGSTQTNEELVRKMFDSVKSVTADFQVDTVENLHSLFTSRNFDIMKYCTSKDIFSKSLKQVFVS